MCFKIAYMNGMIFFICPFDPKLVLNFFKDTHGISRISSFLIKCELFPNIGFGRNQVSKFIYMVYFKTRQQFKKNLSIYFLTGTSPNIFVLGVMILQTPYDCCETRLTKKCWAIFFTLVMLVSQTHFFSLEGIIESFWAFDLNDFKIFLRLVSQTCFFPQGD